MNTGNVNAEYHKTGNWFPAGGPPGATDFASFSQNATYQVWWDATTAANTPDVAGLDVLAGDVTLLNLDGVQHAFTVNNFMTVNGAGTSLTNSGLNLNVGQDLFINDGAGITIDGQHAAGSTLNVLGRTEIGLGKLRIVGGGVGNMAGDLDINVGHNLGAATVEVQGGSQLTTGNINIGTGVIGSAGAMGSLAITGAGSAVNLTGSSELTIGNNDGVGQHEVVVSNGAELNLDTGLFQIHSSGSLTASEGRVTASSLRADGQVQVNSGAVVTSSLGLLGTDVGQTGVAVVSGMGTEWNTNDLRVGRSGNGTLTVEAGGKVFSATGTLGDVAGSEGLAIVRDTESLWDAGSLAVGRNGTGELNIEAGGEVRSRNGAIGFDSDGIGHVIVSGAGSQWNEALSLSVGRSGQGTLNVEAGGKVVSNGGFVGRGSISDGTVLVTGQDSEWMNSAFLQVGELGNGRLDVELGGIVSSNNATIGAQSGATGVVAVSGASSQWNNSNFINVGSLGQGTLLVDGGGLVSTANGFIGVGDTGQGLVTVNGNGSHWQNSQDLTVGELGIGQLNIENGGMVSNVFGSIGLESGGNGNVNVSGAGSRWNNSDGLIVGADGNGTLMVEVGGVVLSRFGTIGQLDGQGITTIRGIGSRWDTTENMNVALRGIGVLNIESGGIVNTGGVGSISSDQNATGIATISGVGSQWNTSQFLSVASLGQGQLNIEAGGAANSNGGSIGFLQGMGTVTVTGSGSQWNSSSYLDIGGLGNGTLQIEDGGLVTSQRARIMGRFGGSGSATVTDVDTKWINAEGLEIGIVGNGKLDILAGGSVSSAQSIVAVQTGSSGVVTVDGAGSTWANTNSLEVGRGGQGILNIQNGGLVTVGDTTSINSQSAVNISGGRFEFGTTTHNDLKRVNATSGSMAGIVSLSGVVDAADLIALQNPAVDVSQIVAANNGLLHGTAQLGSALRNNVQAEIRTLGNNWLRFEGSGNVNDGEINNFGGLVDFAQDVTNSSTGFIAGRGQFIADGGWTNQGVMAFSGTTDILGDIINDAGGQIVTSGGATTTIFDDLVHNGTEIRTSADSRTVIFGEASGAGPYTGTGTVFFEGDLRPGNSPDIVTFEGDVSLGRAASIFAELGGLAAGEFDQLQIAGDLSLDGLLSVSLIDGHQLGFNQEYLIADVGGQLLGQFSDLGEGDLIGNFGGKDLFITYGAGTGNDVALFTAVPEPAFGLLVLTCLGLILIRQRRVHLDQRSLRTQVATSATHDRARRGIGASRRAILLAGGLLTGVVATPSVPAQITIWNGGAGNWTDAANWSNGVPAAGDHVMIDDGNATDSDVLFDGGANSSNAIHSLTLDVGDWLRIANGHRLHFNGGGSELINHGLIQTEGTGSTWITLLSDATFSGTGTIRLNAGGNQINGSGGPALINAAGHTIEGAGSVGGGTFFTNDGLIHANVDGGTLTVDSAHNNLTNNGVIRASSGGTINMFTTESNHGGTYEASGAGSNVELFGGTYQNATFHGSDGGLVRQAATTPPLVFDNLTNQGALQLQTSHVTGNLQNSGIVQYLNAFNDNMVLDGSTTLTGGGTVDFLQGGPNVIGDATLLVSDQTLTGKGTFSPTSISMSTGTILAPSAGLNPNTGIFEFNTANQLFTDEVEFQVNLAGILVDGSVPDSLRANTGTDPDTSNIEYDQFNAFSSWKLQNATFDVDLTDGFVPQPGDFFDVLTADDLQLAGTLTFDFPTINGQTFDHDILSLFDATTGTNRDVLRLTFGAASIPEPGTFEVCLIAATVLGATRRRPEKRCR